MKRWIALRPEQWIAGFTQDSETTTQQPSNQQPEGRFQQIADRS